jgi:hypothetical protein
MSIDAFYLRHITPLRLRLATPCCQATLVSCWARCSAAHPWMSSGSSPREPLFVFVPSMPPPRWAVKTADLALLGPLFPQPRRRQL